MLKNKEIIYRELFESSLQKVFSFTQLGLAKKFSISLSIINGSLAPLIELGVIRKKQRSFELLDAKKLLLYMASIRRLSKDIVYRTNVDMPVMKIEGSLPSGCIFTAFSAYRLLYNDVPADYSEVYVYADAEVLGEIKVRFPEKKGRENLIVLEPDKFINDKIANVSQIYTDLWNIKEWYAKDFVDALGKRLKIWQ